MDFNLRYITGDVAQSGRAHGFHEAGGSNPSITSNFKQTERIII